jgi:hypothetical protein
MRTVSETHAGEQQTDTEVASRVHIPALDLWPCDPKPNPLLRGRWGGAAAILIAGLATIVLISAALFETTHHLALGIWVWLGMPLRYSHPLRPASLQAAPARTRPTPAELRQDRRPVDWSLRAGGNPDDSDGRLGFQVGQQTGVR